MKQFLTWILFLNILTMPVWATFNENSLVSPMFATPTETDSAFRNPADLLFFEDLVQSKLSYSSSDDTVTLGFIGRLPSDAPSYIRGFGSNNFPWGDLGATAEFMFATDGQRIVWVEDSSDIEGGHYSFAKTGFRGSLVWAKQMRFLSIGSTFKFYTYNDVDSATNTRYALGFDTGAYVTPFEDVYMGIVINDLGDTSVHTSDSSDDETALQVDQQIRFTMAVFTPQGSISLGLPLDQINTVTEDFSTYWRRVNLYVRRRLSQKLILGFGYNQVAYFANLDIKSNDYFGFELAATQDYGEDNVTLSAALKLGYSYEAAKRNFGKIKSNDSPTDTFMRAPKKQQAKPSLEAPSTGSGDVYDEIRDELNQQLDSVDEQRRALDEQEEAIKSKQKKLDRLEKKDQILQQLEE